MGSAKEQLLKGVARIRRATVDAVRRVVSIPSTVEMVKTSKENLAIGQEAESWQAHAFTKRFMEFIEIQADETHQRLIDGKLPEGTYAEVYKLLAKLTGFAEAAVASGKKAAEYLAACQEDGTLHEAELYLASGKEET